MDYFLNINELLEKSHWDKKKYPYPNRRLEAWKYENMKKWEQYMWSFPYIEWGMVPPGVHVVIRDSSIAIADQLPKGIRVRIDRELSPKCEEKDAMYWLASQYARHGLSIHLSSMAQVDDPLIIVIEQNLDNAFMNQFKHSLVVEGGSLGSVIEVHQGKQNIHFNQHIWNIQLKRKATLNHYRIDQISDFSFNQVYTDARLEEKSAYNLKTWSCGGAMARHQVTVHLMGEYAHVGLETAAIARNEQSISHQYNVQHKSLNTTSVQKIYGIVLDDAQLISRSQVYVHPGADGVRSEQKNANILEGKLGRVYSQPELEIYAKEVKCNHGATIGKLNEKALFYLITRGLTESDARQMLMSGFMNELLGEWDDVARSFIWDNMVSQGER